MGDTGSGAPMSPCGFPSAHPASSLSLPQVDRSALTDLMIQWGEGERRINKESIICRAIGAITDTHLYPFSMGNTFLE